MWVWPLGQENPLEKEMATCSSIPAWEIPQTEETGGLQFTGLQRVGNYSCLAAIHHSLQDKRFEKMPPIPCPAHCFWWHVQTVVRKHLQRWGPPGDLPTLRNWAFYLLSLSFQFSSVTQSCPTLCDPMDCSTPGFPVHHQLPELDQTQVHQVGDATIYLYLLLCHYLSLWCLQKLSPSSLLLPNMSLVRLGNEKSKNHLFSGQEARWLLRGYRDFCKGCRAYRAIQGQQNLSLKASSFTAVLGDGASSGSSFKTGRFKGKYEREREKASKRGQCSPSWEECYWVLNKKHFVKNIFTDL